MLHLARYIVNNGTNHSVYALGPWAQVFPFLTRDDYRGYAAADTGLVSYMEGSYDLTVTLAGAKRPIIGPVSISLSNRGVYTAVARDAPSGGAPYGLIKLDNLLTPPL